jgi:hypothetical protein
MQAPNAQALLNCFEQCTTPQCTSNCCNSYLQACYAAIVYQGCACGFQNDSCKSECSAACTSSSIEQQCTQCAFDSPCAEKFYDYYYAPGSEAFRQCRYNCGGNAGCLQGCCASHPLPCQARQAAIACVCA